MANKSSSRRASRFTAPAAVGVVIAFVGAACGSNHSSAAASSSSGPTTTAAKAQASSAQDAGWVKWDKASCKFVPATQHPAAWTPKIRKEAQPVTLAFAAQNETDSSQIQLSQGMAQAAKAAGIHLFSTNYQFPSPQEAVIVARSMAQQKPNVVVSDNQIKSEMSAVNKNFSSECAPVIQITVTAPNTIVFGASNSAVGDQEGSYLAQYAKKKGWSAKDITVVGEEDAALGASVQQRVTNCESKVTSAFPGATVSNIQNVNPTTSDAQVAMTDWLTAHPSATHVLGCEIADLYGIGVANALKSSNYQGKSAVMGANGTTAALQLAKQGSPLIGSVDFNWSTYGNYLVPLAEDVLAGDPVPATSGPQLKVDGVLDPSTL